MLPLSLGPRSVGQLFILLALPQILLQHDLFPRINLPPQEDAVQLRPRRYLGFLLRLLSPGIEAGRDGLLEEDLLEDLSAGKTRAHEVLPGGE